MIALLELISKNEYIFFAINLVIMVCKITSAALHGIDAIGVDVETDIKKSEKQLIVIIGLPDSAVRESKDRVLSAILNSGYTIKDVHATINLAPGDLRKEGAVYDLPIACALLAETKQISHAHFGDYLCIGEMGLSGELRPVRGALSFALLAKRLGKKGILLPKKNCHSAAMIDGIDVIPITSLKDAIAFFSAPDQYPRVKSEIASQQFHEIEVDFSDIKGHPLAKRALEIAAAGNHNILFFGPPGTGKTLLAKATTGILPQLSLEESLEVTKIHSAIGTHDLITKRPFRSPHHSVSHVGLIGGGSNPKPGEITLAHRGVLFLDELPEFSRHSLEALRQPLEDGSVGIARANGRFRFPTKCMVVAAMNPCPCGYLGHPKKECRDTETQVNKYRNKISGPLLDRIDMHIEVPAQEHHVLTSTQPSETSQKIRQRVIEARKMQVNRFGSAKTNSEMTPREIALHCKIDKESQKLLETAIDQKGLSARSAHRILKIARTVADLAHSPLITPSHLLESLQNSGFSEFLR